MRSPTARSLVLVLAILCVACGRRGDTLTGPTDLPSTSAAAVFSPTTDAEAPPLAHVTPEVLVGAGDIALCTGDGNHEATARLLDAIGGTVFTLGDNAYVSGTAREFQECYDRTWGRHKHRTRPVPGNHEYQTPGAGPYFDYFGPNAGPRGLGYYSYELAGWHILALNSHIPVSASSAQGAWLRAELAASRARCTLAYWHLPLFSSGPHGNQAQMRDFWRLLYEAGAEVVLSAHDHTYERFAPQDPDGLSDSARGIRQFVAGTGGARPYAFSVLRPNSEVRLSAHGVLKLTLGAGTYEWEFISVSGSSDFGTGTCH